jgi:hypothetical protein
MCILRKIYIYRFFKKLQLTFDKLTVVCYKILLISNYNFFRPLKLCSIRYTYYRLYLLNASMVFIFVDYMYLMSYLKYFRKKKLNMFFLPIKIKSYSVLRSPFVFSKSKEQFAVNKHKLFFDLFF